MTPVPPFHDRGLPALEGSDAPPLRMPDLRSSRSALALRMAPEDSMGTLRSVLDSRGYRTKYLHALPERIRAIDPLQIDILLLLGHLPMQPGPAPAFLPEALDLVRARLHYGLPTLGIDLGAQLMTVALGGQLRALPKPAIGISPLILTESGRRSCLAPLGSGTPVPHWHAHELVLPPSAQALAITASSHVQAFRHGTAMLGLQCHLEADADYVGSRIAQLRDPLADLGLDPMLLRMQASDSLQRLRHACHAVMTRWLDDVGASDSHLPVTHFRRPRR